LWDGSQRRNESVDSIHEIRAGTANFSDTLETSLSVASRTVATGYPLERDWTMDRIVFDASSLDLCKSNLSAVGRKEKKNTSYLRESIGIGAV